MAYLIRGDGSAYRKKERKEIEYAFDDLLHIAKRIGTSGLVEVPSES